ncbi:hypothetical protein D3C72_1394780 [compost metagenome]
MLDRIAHFLQLADKRAEGIALALRARRSVVKNGPPRFELFNVLEEDHARPDQRGPAHRHPSQAPDLLVARLAALGLAEVLAVRAEPGEAYRPALHQVERIHIPHAFAVVLGLRVVHGVHGHCFGIVVDGDVDVPTEGQLNAAACTAAAGEVVDDDLGRDVEQELVSDHAAS